MARRAVVYLRLLGVGSVEVGSLWGIWRWNISHRIKANGPIDPPDG